MRTSTGARPPREDADRRPGWSTARAGYHDPPSRADDNGLCGARHSVRTQRQRRRVGQGNSTCDRPSQTLSSVRIRVGATSGPRRACPQVRCAHIQRVGDGWGGVLTVCSPKGLGRLVDVRARAE